MSMEDTGNSIPRQAKIIALLLILFVTIVFLITQVWIKPACEEGQVLVAKNECGYYMEAPVEKTPLP